MESVSLKDYLAGVRQAISLGVDPDVWVRAEISELRVNPSGHCYLTLIEKEDAGRMSVCAKANAIVWANVYRMMEAMFEQVTHQPLMPGMNVLVRVTPNFHEAYGFSLVIGDIDPTFTLGDMARRRQEVIDRLMADGVWDMNRDLPFPTLPQRIAVISSQTAAGFGDFINQLQQNERGFKFYWHLFPAIMQGVDAPASIIDALDAVFEVQDRFDCVAIVRGGGASADMLAFDDYDLNCCCAQFPLPILSGVGHERDTCVLDMVACKRCKTPTAVAAYLVDCLEQQYSRLCDAQGAFAGCVRQLLQAEKERMDGCVYAITKTVPLSLMQERGRLAALSASLKMAVLNRSHQEEQALGRVKTALKGGAQLLNQRLLVKAEAQRARLAHAVKALMAVKRNRVELLEQKVNLLSPQTLLEKGYSLTLLNGKAVSSTKKLKEGDCITTLLADGTVESVVKK